MSGGEWWREGAWENFCIWQTYSLSWLRWWFHWCTHVQNMSNYKFSIFTVYYTSCIRASQVVQLVKNPPAIQKVLVQFLSWENPLEKGQATHFSILGLPLWLSWKIIHLKSGDLSLAPGLGRSPEEGNGYPFHYSVLDNSIDYMIHRVPKSQIWLRDFHFHTLAKCWKEILKRLELKVETFSKRKQSGIVTISLDLSAMSNKYLACSNMNCW